MKIEKFEEFFTEAKVPYKRVGNRTLVVGRTHFLFNLSYQFEGVAEGSSNIVEPPSVAGKKPVGSRFTRAPAQPRKGTKKEMPWELEHALECDEDGEHEFVQSCLDQWEEKQFLSQKQLDALGRWKAKGED